MTEDLFAANGETAPQVETFKNEPSSPRPTPILGISAESGTFLRILNEVAKGDSIGMPVYIDARDSNGDPLPVNTSLRFELSPAGVNGEFVVSEVFKSIDQYRTLSLSEQRNEDNVDSVKFTLLAPESADNTGPVPHHDVRDVDTLYLSADSAVQVDHTKSAFYFDTEAVQQMGRR